MTFAIDRTVFLCTEIASVQDVILLPEEGFVRKTHCIRPKIHTVRFNTNMSEREFHKQLCHLVL